MISDEPFYRDIQIRDWYEKQGRRLTDLLLKNWSNK
jgi:hypothetical protein